MIYHLYSKARMAFPDSHIYSEHGNITEHSKLESNLDLIKVRMKCPNSYMMHKTEAMSLFCAFLFLAEKNDAQGWSFCWFFVLCVSVK